MTKYRILFTGSQTWEDVRMIRNGILKTVFVLVETGGPGDIVLVHGACKRGGDAIAADVGAYYGLIVEPHPAQWRPYGIYNPQAGLARNREMVSLGADICLAFIKNGSHGATNCAELAEEAGIPVEYWRA